MKIADKFYDGIYFIVFHSSLCLHYFSTLTIFLIRGTRTWLQMLVRLIIFTIGKKCQKAFHSMSNII